MSNHQQENNHAGAQSRAGEAGANLTDVLERIDDARKPNTFKVPVAGHTKPLECSVGIWSCGKITNGVSFEFGDDGGWVIDLAVLKQLIHEADIVRSNV